MPVLPKNSIWQAAGNRPVASSVFTLLELLAAMAVLGLLLMLLAQLFSSVNQNWVRGGADVSRRSNARAFADFIGLELQEAMLPIETSTTKPAGTALVGNLHFVVNPPAGQLPVDYRNADAIFWQAPVATETSYGDIAQLGYFVTWVDHVPSLCRLFINPSIKNADTVEANPDFKVYDSDPTKWLSQEMVEAYIAPADANNGYPGLFAEYVLGFWVECFDREGNRSPRDFDSITRTPVGNDPTTNQITHQLPASVRISIAQSDPAMAYFIAQAENEIRAVTGSADVRNAADFLKEMQALAQTSPAIAKVFSSIRIHTVTVKPINAR